MKFSFIIIFIVLITSFSYGQTELGFFIRYDYDKASKFQFNNCTEGLTASFPLNSRITLLPSVGYRFGNFYHYRKFRPANPYNYRLNDFQSQQLTLEFQLEYRAFTIKRFTFSGIAGIKSNINLYEKVYSPYGYKLDLNDFVYYKNSIIMGGISIKYKVDKLSFSLKPTLGIKVLESDKYLKDPFNYQFGICLTTGYSILPNQVKVTPQLHE